MRHVPVPLRVLLAAVVLLLGGSAPLLAQSVPQAGTTSYQVVYRPSDAQYVVERWPHGDLIYTTGSRETAQMMARVLEDSRPGTDSLVAHTPERVRMPLVVNGFNDRSNGFVTPFPFKQEIEAPGIKEDELVGRFSSWPAVVATHELVHAAHAEVNPGFGVGAVVRFFSPDAARGINLFAPTGFTEGIAVYRESRYEPGAGRLNAPLFHMKMRAAMLSDDPWSLTQMLESPSFTRPFDRHYVGGGHAVAQLAQEDGTPKAEFFDEVTGLHNRLPFFGHGVWLGIALKRFPWQVRNDLRDSLITRYQSQQDALAPFTEHVVLGSDDGLHHRRPYWVNDTTLVAYAQGYNLRAGFYRVDARTGARTPIRVQRITEDFTYSLSRDSSALHVARYVPDPWAERQFIADVDRVSIASGDARRLTDEGRIIGPAELPGGRLAAIQIDGAFTQWAVVTPDGAVETKTDLADARFRQIAPSPTGDRIAVLVNVGGTQHLYRATVSDDGTPTLRPWLGIEDALMYDVSWSADGRYLLFAADTHRALPDDVPALPGITNVHAFDTETGVVTRLTNVPFGALEPALSPDGTTLAYVTFQHERFDLVRIPFRPGDATRLPDTLVLRGKEASLPLTKTVPPAPRGAVGPEGEPEPYRARRYLAPRSVTPVFLFDEDEADRSAGTKLGVGLGATIGGADPLQRWAYDATGFVQDGRLWGDVRVQTARSRLRPSLRLYNEPETLPVSGDRGANVVGFEERGVELGMRLPVTLRRNVFLSVLRVQMNAEYRQTRFFGDALQSVTSTPEAATEFRDRLTLTPAAVLGVGLQQNVRDFIPNRGLVLRAQAETDAWTDGVTPGNAFLTEAVAYLPMLRSTNTGLSLETGLVTKDDGSLFNFDRTLPPGYEDTALPAGTFLRVGAEVVQPVWYPDDGLTTLPLYLRAVGVYGFAQALGDVQGGVWERDLSSVGGGLEVRLRVLYFANLTLRFGAAYRFEANDVEFIGR